MRIKIITIIDNNNYGNRLQNYALTRVLNKYFATATIHTVLDAERAKPWSWVFRYYAQKVFIQMLRHCPNVRSRTRKINFLRFNTLIPEKGLLLSTSRKASRRHRSDVMVLGSDQIWNYRFQLTENDVRLRLGMSAASEKIICYAASIGLNEINERFPPIFREGWSRISHISVREDRAAELIKEISGRDAAVVLDPTLLLTPMQWSEVFTGFVPAGDRYVLTYFLGRPSEAQEEVIQSKARSLGVGVRRLNDPSDREAYAAGPAEFVELFSRAECVFTDSYHACCFSVLFNKPFKVFNRLGFEGEASMNSRMRTLFRLFELKDLMGDDSAMSEFDWDKINELLELRRAESKAWLESALANVAEETMEI